jgi:hypothetical protein
MDSRPAVRRLTLWRRLEGGTSTQSNEILVYDIRTGLFGRWVSSPGPTTAVASFARVNHQVSEWSVGEGNVFCCFFSGK